MTVEQIYTGCLSQGTYYIKCCDEAVIIDPLREVQPYIDKAEADGVRIKYIFETHFHADFVSGHITLAEKTGATIVYGPSAKPDYDAYIAHDGETFDVGKVKIKALHTPGHTLESTTYLLSDKQDEPYAIFTGDTLFLGDVGRPDLAQKTNEISKEDLAGLLYESLRSKIMPLPDDVLVYPAHGAGSACGKNMMKATVDTLGNQKKMNYALRSDMTKAEFVSEVTDGLLPPPAYFPLNVQLNKQGYQSIDKVIDQGSKALDVDEFESLADQSGAIVLDVRSPQEFTKAHIPGSVFIGLDGSFAPWVGALVADIAQPILLVVPDGRAEEAVTRLARIGFDHTLGYLSGGINHWQQSGRSVDSIENISAEQLSQILEDSSPSIIDVRKPAEHDQSAIPGSQLIPLSEINARMDDFPKASEFYIHCAGGYRSVIAASILKKRGWHDVINIAGGMAAIKKSDIQLDQNQCASEIKA